LRLERAIAGEVLRALSVLTLVLLSFSHPPLAAERHGVSQAASDAGQQGAANIGEVTPDPARMEHGVKFGDLVLYDAFTRAMPPAARAGGGFVSILNTGTASDRLVAASSPAAKSCNCTP